MNPDRAGFCMGLQALVWAGLLGGALTAAQVQPAPVKPPAPAPAPGPVVQQPPAQAPAPWVPPVYPERVALKAIKDGEKIGGDLTESLGITNAAKGVKLHTAMTIGENIVVDIGAGSRLYCMPQVGKPETPVTVDGWLTTHGSATAPAYFGAYEGRVKMSVYNGAIRASYTVFKGIDIETRGAYIDCKNCLFIDCTIKSDGSAGGQLDMVNCTLQEGSGKTALAIVRSVRGPVCHLKGIKIDGFGTGMTIDAYDSAMARTCAWDLKELSFTNISGKAIIDGDPIKVDMGRVYLMGEKDAKAAIEKWVETKTPGANQTGTPAVNISSVSPTELGQIGAGITDPTKKDADAKNPTGGSATGIHDDG
ncbi:MAG TPA: hypothetical protein VL860_06695 [Planctomycetota bacterium]|jgi:hypothetical protein|nr:hypothetical protein [Planctomycetota bacterium]